MKRAWKWRSEIALDRIERDALKAPAEPRTVPIDVAKARIREQLLAAGRLRSNS